MSATIGTVTVDSVHGLPQLLKTVVDVWRVPGLNGYGGQQLGLGDGEFEFFIHKYVSGNGSKAANNTAANALIDSLTALQGTVISIVDDWDDTYQHVLIEDGTQASKRPVIYQNDAGAVRVEVHFRACNSSYPGRG